MAGWRYEPAWLVEEMRRNLAWADDVVVVDDRDRTDELWVHEGQYRMMQRQALIDAGIEPWDWVLVTSPDERWDRAAEQVIRRAITVRRRRIYAFPLREMWSATEYRIDGMWGGKWRPRLFPFLPDQRFTRKRIQTPPTPMERTYTNVRLPSVPIYHLENIHPDSRRERAIVYEALSPGSQRRAANGPYWHRYDPDGRYIRRYGYAYLADPRGARFKRIDRGAFTPSVTRPYIFRVPDHLLYKESGKSRAEWEAWLDNTLAGRGIVPPRPGRPARRRRRTLR